MNKKKANKEQEKPPTTKVHPKPLKGKLDVKEYRYIELTNGLRALLIDKSKTAKADGKSVANASILVDFGSFHDKNCSGFAYLLRHLLSSNVHEDFLKNISSSTHCEHITFNLECSEFSFSHSLEKFAEIFKKPLQNMEEKLKEVANPPEPVGAEKVQSRCILLAQKSSKFPSNLVDYDKMKAIGEKTDIELKKLIDEVKEFQEISAKRIYLCVQASQSLNTLEKIVTEYFQGIPNDDLPDSMNFLMYKPGRAFTPDFQQKVFYATTITTTRQHKLELTWVLPPLLAKYKTKPDKYVAAVIMNETEGSLISYLKRHFLAVTVGAATDFPYSKTYGMNSIYSFFTITIWLTAKGFAEIDHVMEAVFSMIKKLKQQKEVINEDYYKELKQIALNNFNYNLEGPMFTEDFVRGMKHFDARDILGGSTLFYAFSQDEISALINKLNERLFNVLITTPKRVPGISYACGSLQWYNIEYGTAEFPTKWKNLWYRQNIPLSVMARNDFVPTNFTNFGHVQRSFGKGEFEKNIKLWYRADGRFKFPQVSLVIYLKSNAVERDLRSAVLLELVSPILHFYMDEKLYPAKQAGLSFQFTAKRQGLLLELTGFCDKIEKSVELWAKIFAEFPEIDKSVFDDVKKRLSDAYKSTFLKTEDMARDLMRNILREYHYPSYEKYLELKNITVGEVGSFMKKFIKNAGVYVIIQGKIGAQKAMDIITSFALTIQTNALQTRVPTDPQRSMLINLGDHLLRVNALNGRSDTSIIQYYWVGPAKTILVAALQVLVSMLNSAFSERFDGGVVNYVEIAGYIGYALVVQCDESIQDSMALSKDVEKFRQEFLQTLRDKTDKEYEEELNHLMLKKLRSAFDPLFSVISKYRTEKKPTDLIFSRRHKEGTFLEVSKKENLIKLYESLLLHTCQLTIHVVGSKIQDKNVDPVPVEPDQKLVEQVRKFKRENFMVLPAHKVSE